MAQRIVYWFRNDLRLNDNEALFNAVQNASEIVPVYVFDPRQFENTKLGFRRTGALRARFLIETVLDLRNSLRKKGGDLLIRVGEPEKIIAQIAEECQAQYVFTSKEIGPEETRIESSLSKNLKIVNIDIKLFWMDTLVHAVDLPFPIAKLPSSYSDFEALIKNSLIVKDIFPEPGNITLPTDFEAGPAPSLPHLGIDPVEIPQKQTEQTLNGESAANAALLNYLKRDFSKNQNHEPITDSRLSDWLSLGCLSARSIYHKTKQQGVEDEAIVSNLLRRDYFHWILLRYGPRIFKPSGVKHDFARRWTNDAGAFESWINAATSNMEVNALILKLKTNGFLTSEERRIASEYLVNELDVNWTWGAMYFESCLLDYEVSVNWGKWNNVAAVGND